MPKYHSQMNVQAVISIVLVQFGLIFLSWLSLYIRGNAVKRPHSLKYFEIQSIILSALAHSIVFSASNSCHPLLFCRALPQWLSTKVFKRKGETDNSHSAPRPKTRPTREDDDTVVLINNREELSNSKKCNTTFTKIFVGLLAFFSVIHLLVRCVIPAAHAQSQEVVLGFVHCFFDCMIFPITLFILLDRYFSDESNGKLSVSQWNRRRTLFFRSCFCLGILLVLIFFVKAAKAKTIPELSRTILGPLMDPCSTENMEMNPRLLKRSWVWPAITYRRLFNFYTGSEECRPKSQSIAFLDRETEELIVSSRCADQTEPRILLYEPSNTDLAKPEKIDRMDLIPDTPIVYHDILNRVFKNGTDKVRVHRDKSGVLLSVEVNLEKYRALERAAKNPAERAQMEKWPSSKVYAIPLGLTASYLVQCPKKGHEEIFFYPVPADLYGSEDIVQNASFLQNNTNITFSPEKPEPAGSVFTFIFDAVSRQEVARILPKFSQWIQGFKKRQDEKKSGGRGYFVVEPPGYTTIGFSTRHNMDYLFFGKSFEEEKMYHSIYNVVKYKHGVDVSTSMTMGYCHNSIMFGGYDASIPEDSHIGLGSRFFGVDHHFFSPLCHQDFGTVLGNFKGPNSITKRCLAGEHVHNHLLSYMSPLLKQHVILAGGEGTASSKIFPHLKPSAFKSGNKYFMDFAIFTEGHEGTHSVLALLDDDLTQFMKDLEEKIGFFDNPQNTFIFTADHGNHMGPYFEFTTAGQLERTTPAMIIIAHPEMMEKIDVNKGQEIGTSERNFKERMKRLWTNADLYYTLGDIFGVTAELNQVKEMFQEKYAPAKVLPSSLFDDHTVGPLKTCKDYGHNIGEYCLLDFCRPKEE